MFTVGPNFFISANFVRQVFAGDNTSVFCGSPFTLELDAIGVDRKIPAGTPLLWELVSAIDGSGNPIDPTTVTFSPNATTNPTIAIFSLNGDYVFKVTLYPNTPLSISSSLKVSTTPSSYTQSLRLGSVSSSDYINGINQTLVGIFDENKGALGFVQTNTHRNLEWYFTPMDSGQAGSYWFDIQYLNGSVWTTIKTVSPPVNNSDGGYFVQLLLSESNTYGYQHRIAIHYNFQSNSVYRQTQRLIYSDPILAPTFPQPQIPMTQSVVASLPLASVRNSLVSTTYTIIPSFILEDLRSNVASLPLASVRISPITVTYTVIPSYIVKGLADDVRSQTQSLPLASVRISPTTKTVSQIPGGIVIGT